MDGRLVFYGEVKVEELSTKKKTQLMLSLLGSAYGNRTRVPCVRGMCPSR